jgi:hypothetical protein
MFLRYGFWYQSQDLTVGCCPGEHVRLLKNFFCSHIEFSQFWSLRVATLHRELIWSFRSYFHSSVLRIYYYPELVRSFSIWYQKAYLKKATVGAKSISRAKSISLSCIADHIVIKQMAFRTFFTLNLTLDFCIEKKKLTFQIFRSCNDFYCRFYHRRFFLNRSTFRAGIFSNEALGPQNHLSFLRGVM